MTSGRGGVVAVVAFIAVVAAVVAAGFLLVGSPAAARRERLDERRVTDLEQVSRAVNVYWTRRDRLPDTLVVLAAEPGLGALPTDPDTGVAYEYRTTGSRAYELCATFAGTSNRSVRSPLDFWAHGAGRQCFSLEAVAVR